MDSAAPAPQRHERIARFALQLNRTALPELDTILSILANIGKGLEEEQPLRQTGRELTKLRKKPEAARPERKYMM